MTDPSAQTAPYAGFDADFGRRLDQWGAYQRIGIGALGLVLSLLVTSEVRWVQGLCGLYLAWAIPVPWLVAAPRDEAFKARLRVALMLGDLLAVSTLTYGWGTHSSPAAFMYLPIVVGFTLVPQRNLGRVALLLALTAVGGALVLEVLGLIPYAPLRIAQTPPAAGSRALFFGLFALALAAVQGAVESTVARVRAHGLVVSRLSAEKERREREHELSAQLEEAARLESLGRLSGGIAHDFNNLLMALLGHAELARQKLHADLPFVAGALSDIERAAENGRALTAQLLDFACRRPERAETVELARALGGAEKLLARLLRPTVTLELILPDEPCHVRIDPSSLERVLFNLAINASDAMPDGGALRLALTRDDARAAAVIAVTDQGTGIAAEDLPHIFEPFFTRKARGKGTGLGLSSVYGIVRQSRGEIDVTSRIGEGTTFFLRFPLCGPPAPERRSSPDLGPAGSGQLLLVDDNELVRSVVHAQLKSGGYDVMVAASADEALALLGDSHRFDLLISDVVMPLVSGVDLAKHARLRFANMPILLVSGYAAELSLETLNELNARLLLKPFGTKQLLEAVAQALRGV